MASEAESAVSLGPPVSQGAGRLAALVVLGATACTEPVETVELGVYGWWSRPSEERALDYLIRTHEESHEKVRIINYVDTEANDARDLCAQRLLAGSPPATFQANIGADLLRWAAADTEGGDSFRLLQGLEALFDRTGLSAELPRELLEALRIGGSDVPYAVPINVHRENLLYYNQARLDAFIETHGHSFLDLATLCPENTDVPLPVRIAVSREGWALTLFALENVLPALTSAGFYDALMRGQAPTVAPGGDWTVELERALTCVQYLSRSFAFFESWSDAVDEIRDGRADFTVMGDWASGELAVELSDRRVRAVPFPGTERYFVFTSDTFPLPVRAKHPDEILKLLETVASERVQIEFSKIKGSIPARSKARLDDQRALDARRAFQDAEQRVLATSGRFPPYFDRRNFEGLLGLLVQGRATMDPASVQDLVKELRHSLKLFAEWQARLAEPAGEPL
jgi:glucose/mannose transport system substrate-binding protein